EGHEVALVIPGAVDAGPGGVDVDTPGDTPGPPGIPLPHLHHVDAVADGGGGENADLVVGVELADGGEGGGGTPIVTAVVGELGVEPVLDRVGEEQDDAGQALEGHPEAEHDRQTPV